MESPARPREVRSIRTQLGVGKVGGRYVVVHAAEPLVRSSALRGVAAGIGCVPWHLPRATISISTVPSEFKDIRSEGPTEQRAWPRTGDTIDVDVHVTWPDPWSGPGNHELSIHMPDDRTAESTGMEQER